MHATVPARRWSLGHWAGPRTCPRAAAGGNTRSEMTGHHGNVAKVPAAPALIRARGLTKRFGSFTAVDGIDFELRRGEAFGFLGPNGAGKSSTMRMIGCVSPPTGGVLRILGKDPVKDGS